MKQIKRITDYSKKLFSSVDALCEPHIMKGVIDINRAVKGLTY